MLGTVSPGFQGPVQGLTLMRPPIVKRQTTPRSGFLALFPLGWSWRSRHPVACADVIATDGRRQRVAAPNTSCDALVVAMTRAEKPP